MRAQERHHGGAPEPEGRGGRGSEPHERPKPPFVGGGTEGERLRIKPVELPAQPTGETPPLLTQLILHRDHSRSSMIKGSSGASARKAGWSVARAVASTNASRRSSLAPATV